MYRCGTCGGNHRKIETGKKCAQDAARRGTRKRVSVPYPDDRRTPQERSYDAWATSPTRGSEETEGSDPGDAVRVPNGHYFIPAAHWPPDGLHTLVRQFKTGRWKDVWFVTVFSAAQDDAPELIRTIGERQFIVERLLKAGPLACMLEYGNVYFRCGVCNEELSPKEMEYYSAHVECFRQNFPSWKKPVIAV